MYSDLLKIIPTECVKLNEPMKNHTSFKIGGPVDLLIETNNVKLLKKVISWAQTNQQPLVVFGKGSNLLVRDKGIRGIAIKLCSNIDKIIVNCNVITAEAGISLSALAKVAAQNSLTGLEFAEGIPGSLGGAIFMNAGAYDGEMKNVLTEVEAISLTGEIKRFSADELQMSYRKSIFQTNGYYIISAALQLQKGNQEDILAKMQGFAQSRKEKQPIEYPSAGSTFKRPPGYFVGPMIEELGLKGFSIGGAQVSAKHAGFIINTGDATAQNVIDLIVYVQEKVTAKYGVTLETELKIIGEK